MIKKRFVINPKKSKNNHEKNILMIEKEKFKWEKSRTIVTVVGLIATFFTVYLGYYKFSDQKDKEREAQYRETLYNLLSNDISDNKIGLKEIIKFDSHYEESVPILINMLITMNNIKYNELKNFYSSSAVIIGKPFYPFFQKYLNSNSEADTAVVSRIQWLLSQFIKTGRDKIELNKIKLTDFSLVGEKFNKLDFYSSNIEGSVFDNCIFNSCDFSNSIFRNCSLWQAKFLDNVNLNGVRFENCNFQESVIRSKFNNTIFDSCYVNKLKVSDLQKDIFKNCGEVNTVQRINN